MRLLTTAGDSFMGEKNEFKNFLQERTDLPRLSILDNYKQIKRIMTSSYLKSFENDKKYQFIEQQQLEGEIYD